MPRNLVTRVSAIVQAGGIEIRYSRSGRGAPVLLLIDRPVLRDALRDALAQRFRVIVPELEGLTRIAPPIMWLRGLIDGLGLRAPRIVVDAEHAAAVRELAGNDTEELGRVALIECDTASESQGETQLLGADAPERPWLKLRLTGDAGASPARVVELQEFLQGCAGS